MNDKIRPEHRQRAAYVYVRRHGAAAVECAKLDHRNEKRCIFCGGKPRFGKVSWELMS